MYIYKYYVPATSHKVIHKRYYENTPIQIHWKFYNQNWKIFR